jgi:hypothetical protein
MRRDTPLASAIGENGSGLAIVALDHATNKLARRIGKSNGLSDAEVHHLSMSPDLLHQPKTRDNHMVGWTSSSSVRRSSTDTRAGRLHGSVWLIKGMIRVQPVVVESVIQLFAARIIVA